MAFIAYIRAVEADGFGFQLATAAVEAVLAVIVWDWNHTFPNSQSLAANPLILFLIESLFVWLCAGLPDRSHCNRNASCPKGL